MPFHHMTIRFKDISFDEVRSRLIPGDVISTLALAVEGKDYDVAYIDDEGNERELGDCKDALGPFDERFYYLWGMTEDTGIYRLNMLTRSEGEQKIARKIASTMRYFLEHTERYKRDVDGRYPWAWTGDKILCKVQQGREFEELHETVKRTYFANNNSPELIINEVPLGKFEIWTPYAYPASFLVLKLPESLQYKPSVVTQFAQYAGYQLPRSAEDKRALKSKLAIEH